MVKTKITRLGNSKGFIVPASVVKALGLEEGDEVELRYDSTTQTLSATFPKTKQLKLTIH